MINDIKELVDKCDICQRRKTTNNPRAEKIPSRKSHSVEVFELLTVDLYDPWKMRTRVEYEVNVKDRERKLVRENIIMVDIFCLTMIDETARWPKIVPIKNKQSKNIVELTDSEWFCRYLRPLYCLHDNGKEFIGKEFDELLESYEVTSQPTTIKKV